MATKAHKTKKNTSKNNIAHAMNAEKNFFCGFSSHAITLIVFGVSLFLSASLMFAVQPMIGKMLLPLAGGTPASWIVAMAFFQIALLMGYMLAWIMSRFDVRTHTLLLVVLLGLGFIFLPVRIADYANILETDGISPGTIFVVLLLAVGLPFTALSTVSSTLQRLFTATTHKDAKDPYFLYAASNTGSLIGLLSYPLMIEPLLPLHTQSSYWQVLYGGLIAMCLVCLAFTSRKEEQAVAKKVKAAEKTDHENITWHTRITWLLLAFFPSSLLMGTTMHITIDIISVPLLWVVPLGLYLITHIMAFSRKKYISADTLYKAQGLAVCAIVLVAAKFPGLQAMTVSWEGAFICLIAFFLIALALHTYLSENRPHNKHLTQFYFFLALGGALGGSFNAFLAPVIFNDILEFPIVAIASCCMNPYFRRKIANSDMSFFTAGLVLAGLLTTGLALNWFTLSTSPDSEAPLLQVYFLLLMFTLLVNIHAKLGLYVSIAVFCMAGYISSASQDIIVGKRNFFGVMRVVDNMTITDTKTNTRELVRYFMHGTTLHGLQKMDVDLTTSAITSYYGPLITAIDAFKPKHVALLGLGAGTIRCYHAPDRHYTMYEIDPEVVEVAEQSFGYLDQCGSDNDAIVVGDGRLEMQKREDDRYDMIIMDAFSSDSIPVHLITVEALQMYRTRLTEDGVIAIHISNRYLDLKHVITATAAQIGLTSSFIHQIPSDDPLQVSSVWIILTAPETNLSPLMQKGWLILPPEDSKTMPWTDEYSNILSAIRFGLF